MASQCAALAFRNPRCRNTGRSSGKDAAVLDAIAQRQPKTVLDIGCGEGWLIRHLRQNVECHTVGLDGSPELLAAAAAADPAGLYVQVDYDTLIADAWPESCPTAGFDVVVFNFSLFAEEPVPILRAAASRLASGGALIIQTLSLEILSKDRQQGGEGWRVEDFTGFGTGTWSPMRWYCHSTSSWIAAVAAAGLTPIRIATIRAKEPLSLLLIACPAREVSLTVQTGATPEIPGSGGAESTGSNP